MKMQDIVNAAAAARKLSVGNRAIEILVTEIGFIVRGRDLAGDDEQEARPIVSASEELGWAEFEGNPYLLTNSVYLIDVHLDGKVRTA